MSLTAARLKFLFGLFFLVLSKSSRQELHPHHARIIGLRGISSPFSLLNYEREKWWPVNVTLARLLLVGQT